MSYHLTFHTSFQIRSQILGEELKKNHTSDSHLLFLTHFSDTLLDYEEKTFDEKREDVFSTNPTVFNFYNYLRSHPLVVRQKRTENADFSNQTMLLVGFPSSSQGYNSSTESTLVVNKLSLIERR